MLVLDTRETFDLVKEFMADPDYRIYWAEGLHRDDDQDYAVVFDERHGCPEYVVAMDYDRFEYEAFWRLVRWNNWRLDALKEN